MHRYIIIIITILILHAFNQFYSTLFISSKNGGRRLPLCTAAFRGKFLNRAGRDGNRRGGRESHGV